MPEEAESTIIDLQKIKNIFEAMDYGQNLDGTAKVDEWLNTVNIVEQSGEINNILKSIDSKYAIPTASARKSALLKLARDIENNADILGQIEIQSRGILSKDTKKYIPLLVGYIKYYAFFPKKYELFTNNAKGFIVGILDDDTPLWMLALIIGPAIASGYKVVLQAGTKLSVVATYIFQLAKKAGVPDQFTNLISSNKGNTQIYLDNTNVYMLTIFGDLFDPSYEGTNKNLIRTLHFSSYNTPMIVFDSGDIDSAVESVIENAWGYQGMQPWAINKILIQENIFEKFTAKLKKKMSLIKIGNGNNKQADLSFPSSPTIALNLKNLVEKAKLQGVEGFQAQENSINFTPTLLIGMNVETNNVIKGPQKNGAVTLLPFRFIDEAVNLANNSRQGFGASVWTENIGLANEVARKLEVNNVWINSHGLISVEAPLVPLKDSGNGSFGGELGFKEYLNLSNEKQEFKTSNCTSVNSDQAVINAINLAKNAGISWRRTSYQKRVDLVSKILDQIEILKQSSSDQLLSQYIDQYVNAFNQHIRQNQTLSSPYVGYELISQKMPRGVLVFRCGGLLDIESKVVLDAILEGNAIIILTGCVGTSIKEKIYLELSKKLPAGLFSVFPATNEAVFSIVSHKAVNSYINVSSGVDPVLTVLPLKDSKVYGSNFCVIFKNIWSNVGQSITCNI